ncbi:DNA-binding GntR family transcriptional regulator [Kribbella aluminosa]|uniref:DNA-binding GntR family transcriptional regulator n=1 Tax=Kribbella aluminosa TaxID=416017 RepID=A0ABS4UZ80_9ACTN|nr:GntR family transcriptional regulator [Kribbella aluminosa]MBP2356952.1 DNA-binding GntR family transcriptional regulator [Kribbella aluminosa]
MTSYIEPLAQESTPSIIADKLRKAIGHGEFKPGAQLVEADLARKLGVSRGPLREGMQRLTQEGLLVPIRNRGLFVIDMTPAEIRDMYYSREAIERAAAMLILRDGDFETVGLDLHAIAEQMKPVRNDPAAVGEIDIQFHEFLVRASGSPRLVRMHRTQIIETRMCIHALEATYAAADNRYLEHRRIAAAIRDCEIERTEELLSEHMEDAIERLVNKKKTN